MVLLVTGCGARDADPPAPSDPVAPSTPALADADMWLAFEDATVSYDGQTGYADALGRDFVAQVVTSGDGEVRVVAGAGGAGDGGAGDGVSFPQKCVTSTGCPRAMLEVAPDPALDPGTRDFTFGAAVWLAPQQTTSGSNIVQKGRFGTGGGQWKLQVDDADGRPSCVVVSGEGDVVRVRSEVSIADSAWHRIECRRDRTGVSIAVDGAVETAQGSTGSVSNESPIRIGSPGVGEGDDQFHGRVDDVFLAMDE